MIPSQPTDPNVHTRSTEIVIRSAQAQDLRSLAELLTCSFYDLPPFLGWIYPLLQLGIYEDLRSRLRSHSPLYCCLVASLVGVGSKDAIVGTVEIAIRSPFWLTTAQYPYISNLAVSSNYRRQGIGQKLLSECERVALNWGYEKIRLHVLESNYPAKQLYFRSGYRLQSLEPDWSGWLWNQKQRLLLDKQLSQKQAK